MKLTIVNGSPRGKNSNSSVITNWLLEEAMKNPAYDSETVYLNKLQEHENVIDKMKLSDVVVIIFPLYTDCMPGLVMAFIEKLQAAGASLPGKKLGFIVHSGFPEANHSRYVEKYLNWLARELKSDYMGTVVIAGSEGFRIMNESMTRKKRNLVSKIGLNMLEAGTFDSELLKMVAGTEKYSFLTLLIFKILAKTGLTNLYWNSLLKNNKAFDNRYARPYM